MPEKELNALYNRCDCMNRVHGFANEVVPELLEELTRGFKLTVSYNLYTKDKDRLQAIIDVYGDGVDACIWSDRYFIAVELSDNYPSGYWDYGSSGYRSEYYKHTVYLWNVRAAVSVDFQPLPLHTHDEFTAAKKSVVEIETQLREVKERLQPLKQLISE